MRKNLKNVIRLLSAVLLLAAREQLRFLDQNQGVIKASCSEFAALTTAAWRMFCAKVNHE